MTSFRTASGGRVDRARPLSFTFDGVRLGGLAGDTLASALLANGVHLVGRSFKYHRPRGILGSGADEPNALVSVLAAGGGRTPNLRATQIELYDGLVAESQNRFPSLRFDLGAVADLLAPVLPAGFYYKTFKWPPSFWARVYEPLIRRAAGLGRAPIEDDGGAYTSRYAHCDVLVVGAGPAGLAAARSALAAGARVILCDEQSEPGGSLLAADDSATLEGMAPHAWMRDALGQLAQDSRFRLLARTTAFGVFPHLMVGLMERLAEAGASDAGHLRERLWQVRAKAVVVAAGAAQRPIVFPGNDRPGVMLASAAEAFVRRYGVRPGTRAVVATADDAGYAAAAALHAAGVAIAAVADLRTGATLPAPGPVIEAARILGTHGRTRVSAVDVSCPGRPARRIACDLLLMSGGATPAVHLLSQAGVKLAYDDGLRAFVPGASDMPVFAAGAARGVLGAQQAAEDGARIGRHAAERTGAPVPPPPVQDVRPIAGVTRPPAGAAFVDFQNDVTAKDLALAVREGFRSVEHVKRYTTTGMATDQGRTSNMNALDLLSGLLDRPVPAVGLTTFRMPYTPVTLGALAGRARGNLFDPVRTTPLHDWAERQGAVFEDVGNWRRARYFPKPNEDMHASVARECLAVRQSVGIFDASTLGKIEVVGPDAAEFMNRMYVNAWTRLAPGRCRYGVMLREDGFVFDDGVVGRLAQDRFHVTTTTGGAARVLAFMEDYRQTEFPELDVWLTSTTEHWAVIAVQGPHARALLAPLVDGVDLAAMPHMALAECRVAGVAARLFRVSFTGELGFEVNVPAGRAPAVLAAILQAGEPLGAVPYGTEAMHVLRAEKGYIIVGQDTDGTATPGDAGLGWAVGKSKPDFVGKRSLARPAMRDPGRRQLVGLLTSDPGVLLEEGAQVAARAAGGVPEGHVTSSYRSATLGRSIALAMLAGGQARHGETVQVLDGARRIAAEVAGTVFYDPDGTRLDG